MWRQHKNKEQADLIRQCNSVVLNKVTYLQGEIDGSLYIIDTLLEEYKKQLIASPEGESNNPTY